MDLFLQIESLLGSTLPGDHFMETRALPWTRKGRVP